MPRRAACSLWRPSSQMAVAGASAQPTFVIKSSSSGLVLDVPWASTQPGTQIQQWTPTGNPNQSWLLQLNSGCLVIKSLLLWSVDPWGRRLHLVFDIPYASTQPGAILQQWTETDNPNQL